MAVKKEKEVILEANDDNVTINIPRGAKGEDNFKIVSVGMKVYKIKRGVDVVVPKAIAEAYEMSVRVENMIRDYQDDAEN